MSTKYIGGITIETDKKMRERSPQDFYPTERALINAYLLWNSPLAMLANSGYRVADLGSGDGRWGQAVKKFYPKIRLIGTDIRDLPQPEGFDVWFSGATYGDIYNIVNLWNVHGLNFDVIIGNPPYSIAEDWLDICFSLINREHGKICLLLPLNWLASERRAKKYYNNAYPLTRLVVCSTRPSFSENGKTYPGREYAIFEWHFSAGGCMSTWENDRNPIEFLHYDRNNG